MAPHLLVGSDKFGTVYLLNADDLGGFDTGTNGADRLNGDVQDFPGGGLMIYNFAFFNNMLYTSNPLSAFSFVPGTSGSAGYFNSTPVAKSAGVQLSAPTISANGTANGLVWTESQGGVLLAYTPALSEVYDSTQAAGGRDTPPTFVKFTSPVIANGRGVCFGAGCNCGLRAAALGKQWAPRIRTRRPGSEKKGAVCPC